MDMHKTFNEYWKDRSLMSQNQALDEVVQIAESKTGWESYAKNYLRKKGLSEQEIGDVIETVKNQYGDNE